MGLSTAAWRVLYFPLESQAGDVGRGAWSTGVFGQERDTRRVTFRGHTCNDAPQNREEERMELGNESLEGAAGMVMNGQKDKCTHAPPEQSRVAPAANSGFLSPHPSHSLPGRPLPAQQ